MSISSAIRQASPWRPILTEASRRELPAAKIPSSLINNIGQAMINLYPTPNANNAAAGYNFVNAPVRQLNETKFDGRLDYNFSQADTLFGRFSYDQAFSYVPGGSTPPAFASANAFGTNQRIINHARNAAIGETHVFSASMVNQANFGYNRIFDYIASQGTGTCASATIVPGGIPNANLGCPGALLEMPGTSIAAVWSLRIVAGRLLGCSAIAGILPSRAEQISSRSGTRSISSAANMTFTLDSTSGPIR